MSVSLVSFRMARIRSREPACRIRSSCTWEVTVSQVRVPRARIFPNGLGFLETGAPSESFVAQGKRWDCGTDDP